MQQIRRLIVLATALVAVCSFNAFAAEQKVLRYAFEVAETGFDPVQLSDLYSRNITREIFEAPLHFAYLGVPGTLLPLTASALPEIAPDFSTYTFHIKPGIYFADDPAFKGNKRELVAADYVYSIKRHYDPRWKSVQISELETFDIVGLAALRKAALAGAPFDYDKPVPGLQTLDRYTFRVTLGKPNPRLAEVLADSSVMGAVAREVVEFYGDRIMEHPVGTGPYKLAEWRRSSFIALDRNPSYREEYFDLEPDPTDAQAVAVAAKLKGRRLPMIDRFEIAIIEESQPRWLSFLNNEQDVLETLPEDLAPIAIPNNKASPTLEKKHVTVLRAPRIDVSFVVYNMENPVIGGYTPEQIALRRAINLALDTDEIIRSRYKYQAFPAQSMVMPQTYGYDPDLRTETGLTDVARANALLDVYGWKDRDGDGWRETPSGEPLELELSTQPDQRSRIIDEIWKKAMNALHIKLRYRTAKWPEQLRLSRNGQYMIWYLGLSASSPDGASSLRYFYGPAVGAENLARFRNARFDAAFDEQNALGNGPERIAKIRELQKIFTAYAPGNVTVHRYAIDMSYPWVIGYRRWPFASDWWKYADIDVDVRKKELGR
jgi:ABC-type transport system substrate-binding protein